MRLRDDHVTAKTAPSNQLGALLDAHWPGPKAGPKALFYRMGSEITMTLLTDYHTSESVARLGEARMAAFLRRRAYRGGKTPTELLGHFGQHPPRPPDCRQVLARLVGIQIQLLRTCWTPAAVDLAEFSFRAERLGVARRSSAKSAVLPNECLNGACRQAVSPDHSAHKAGVGDDLAALSRR